MAIITKTVSSPYSDATKKPTPRDLAVQHRKGNPKMLDGHAGSVKALHETTSPGPDVKPHIRLASKKPYPKRYAVWLSIAGVALAGVVTGVILTMLLGLHACHLCVAQRLVFMLIIPPALVAAAISTLGRKKRNPSVTEQVSGLVVTLMATAGFVVAIFQSVSERFESVSCSAPADPGLLERAITVLGRISQTLFAATRGCGDDVLFVLGASLANIGALVFLAMVGVSATMTCGHTKRPPRTMS